MRALEKVVNEKKWRIHNLPQQVVEAKSVAERFSVEVTMAGNCCKLRFRPNQQIVTLAYRRVVNSVSGANPLPKEFSANHKVTTGSKQIQFAKNER